MRRMAACVVVIGLVSTLALSASVAAPPRRHVTIAAGAVDGVYYPIAGAMSRITSDARRLSGRPTGEWPVGSGSEQNALQILEIYGIGGGDLRAAVRVSFTAAVDQLKAGVVDAAFFTTALGAPVVAEAFGSGQLELLGVGPTAGEALGRKYPFYTIGEIPANTYKGQEREVATASVMAMLVARSALSEDLVYRFTKAVFDNLPQLYAAHAAARNLTLQTALVGMPLPLHRGAERFFKEKGISR